MLFLRLALIKCYIIEVLEIFLLKHEHAVFSPFTRVFALHPCFIFRQQCVSSCLQKVAVLLKVLSSGGFPVPLCHRKAGSFFFFFFRKAGSCQLSCAWTDNNAACSERDRGGLPRPGHRQEWRPALAPHQTQVRTGNPVLQHCFYDTHTRLLLNNCLVSVMNSNTSER